VRPGHCREELAPPIAADHRHALVACQAVWRPAAQAHEKVSEVHLLHRRTRRRVNLRALTLSLAIAEAEAVAEDRCPHTFGK
jgi:ferric-dicitrate binding protein FerR (iron transport regulator)